MDPPLQYISRAFDGATEIVCLSSSPWPTISPITPFVNNPCVRTVHRMLSKTTFSCCTGEGMQPYTFVTALIRMPLIPGLALVQLRASSSRLDSASTVTLATTTFDAALRNHVSFGSSIVNRKTSYRTLGTNLPLYFHSGYPPVVAGKKVHQIREFAEHIRISKGQSRFPSPCRGLSVDPIRDRLVRRRVTTKSTNENISG